MTISEMKQILAAGNLQLTKSLGQNFLHDANQLRRIVDLAELSEKDRVLEIGPGLGPLTELLLPKVERVLAIEMDRRLAAVLAQRLGGAQNLSLIQDDALRYIRNHPTDWSEWKLVSNLPYSVASSLLVELAQSERSPRALVCTLQLEVARRLFAHAGEKDYGVLSLLVQLRYCPEKWLRIPASCFFPEPAVDSACVKLVARGTPLLERSQEKTFARIVKRGFSQRRKMMLKLLKQDWPSTALESAFAQLGLSGQVRAEAVTLDQFVKLSQILSDAGRNL